LKISFQIRKAREEDTYLVLQMIRELASFEKLDLFRNSGFIEFLDYFGCSSISNCEGNILDGDIALAI